MEKIEAVKTSLEGIPLDDSTPVWVSIIIKCLSELVDAVKESTITNERFTQMESLFEVRGTIIDNIKRENEVLKKDLQSVKLKADSNEQKSRSACLLIHRIEEKDGEDTDKLVLDVVNDKVGVSLCIEDIERSHRTGPKRPVTTRRTKPRPVIIRFASMRKRMEVFRSKKELRGEKLVITESLTAMRYDLLQKAKAKFGERNVWTSEGKIMTKCENKLLIFTSIDELL